MLLIGQDAIPKGETFVGPTQNDNSPAQSDALTFQDHVLGTETLAAVEAYWLVF
jgi:hypothetical protein